MQNNYSIIDNHREGRTAVITGLSEHDANIECYKMNDFGLSKQFEVRLMRKEDIESTRKAYKEIN